MAGRLRPLAGVLRFLGSVIAPDEMADPSPRSRRRMTAVVMNQIMDRVADMGRSFRLVLMKRFA
ncbi:hypothetical protein ASE01_07360 [Nocardioides sp. Root190]|nr:hypothetical protein ASE01_07360 [Nocardioides sp. Root190]